MTPYCRNSILHADFIGEVRLVFWRSKQFWGTLIAVALLAYCVKDITLTELQALSHRVNYLYLIPAVGGTFLFIIFRALRWKLMLSQHRRIKRFRVIALYSAGQVLNIVMPALTGQVGRLILFAKKEGLRKTFVFSTIVLEVLFDALSLVIFLMFTSVAFVFPDGYRSVGIAIAVVTVVLLALLWLMVQFRSRLEEVGRRHLRHRWPGFYVSVKKFVRSFAKGIETLRSSQHFFGTFGYSLASWTAHTLVIYFLFLAFGFRLPFAAAATVMIINTLALMVPITPGNAGTFEVAVSTSLTAFAVGRSDAVLFSVALHILDLLPVFAFGFSFLHLERLSIREIKSQHKDEKILERVSDNGTLIETEEPA